MQENRLGLCQGNAKICTMLDCDDITMPNKVVVVRQMGHSMSNQPIGRANDEIFTTNQP